MQAFYAKIKTWVEAVQPENVAASNESPAPPGFPVPPKDLLRLLAAFTLMPGVHVILGHRLYYAWAKRDTRMATVVNMVTDSAFLLQLLVLGPVLLVDVCLRILLLWLLEAR